MVLDGGGQQVSVEPGEVNSWVDAGIITGEQRDAILALADASPQRSSAVREVLGYLGAALVLVAAFILVSDLWEEMTRATRVLVSLTGAAVLLISGLYLAGNALPAVRRVGRTLQLLAVPPFGLAVGLALDASIDEDTAVVMGFTSAAILSGILYARDRAWAQHLALFGSLIGVASSLGATIDGSLEPEALAGIGTLAVSLAWLAGAMTNRLPPRTLGELVALGGLFIASIEITGAAGWGTGGGVAVMALWIATSIAILAAGVILDRTTLIVGGILGLLMWLSSFIFEVFEDGAGGPISMLVGGGILIGAAVYLTRRANRA